MRGSWRQAICAVVCACACARGVAAQRAPDEALERAADTQLWPDVTLALRPRPDLAIQFFGTVRLGHNASDPFTEQVGIGVNYAPRKYLTTFAGYRFVSNHLTPGRASTEHRYFFDVTPRLALGHKFTVIDRNRVEWRDINGTVSHRYRNRPQIERDCAVGEHRFTPYLAAEIFYDDRFHGWTRRQFFAGSRWQLSKHVALDTHFARQLDDRARPGRLSIVGVMFRFEY